jgi:hypothetical protein
MKKDASLLSWTMTVDDDMITCDRIHGVSVDAGALYSDD